MHAAVIVVGLFALGAFLVGRSCAYAARNQRAVLLDRDGPPSKRIVYRPLPTTIV
jgi:hypothetical protein